MMKNWKQFLTENIVDRVKSAIGKDDTPPLNKGIDSWLQAIGGLEGDIDKLQKIPKPKEDDIDPEGVLNIWYNSDEDKIFVNYGDWADEKTIDKLNKQLKPLASELDYDREVGDLGEGWEKLDLGDNNSKSF